MCSEVAASVFVHDALEERAENRGRNEAPVEGTAFEQQVAHGCVETGNPERFTKEGTVDIGKTGELFVEGCVPFVRGRVEYLEKVGNGPAGVGAVWQGLFADVVLKVVFGVENASVVGKEAIDEADEKKLEVVAIVSGVEKGVVEMAHFFGDLDVDGVFVFVDAFLVAGNEAKATYVFGKVGKWKFLVGAFVEVVEAESGEVGDEDIFGEFFVFEADKVVEGLGVGFIEILSF